VMTTPVRSSGASSGWNAGASSGGAADLALGQHRAAGVVHRREQVRRAAVGAYPVGAAQGLAIDGDGPPPAGCGCGTLLVGQPGANSSGQGVGVQARQGPADGGLGGDGEVPGGVVAGAERGPHLLGCVGGPFGDRGDRPGTCQHRGGGQAQDGGQRVAAAAGGSRVGDTGEVGQQARGVGVLELKRVGMGEVGQGGWDRG
jgi:hypothetical protein